MSDDLGDRMKGYEAVSTSRKAFKGQPFIVRLDGRGFHNFTKGLKRPFDPALSALMMETTKALVDHFQPKVGYTQSDEITLAFYVPSDGSESYPFDGRLQKLESLTAAYATAFFNRQLPVFLPKKAEELPVFDARAFVVPNFVEAYNCVLWRQQDATKNAISMAAQSMFPHKELQGKSGNEMQEMMLLQKCVNFNDYPYFFKRGTFVKRRKVDLAMNDDDRARIPKKHWPANGIITRTLIMDMDIWLAKQPDPVAALFTDTPIV